MPKSNNTTVNIDATGQSLGRLASRIAILLQDKNKATFEPNKAGTNTVIVNNFSKIHFKGNKPKTKIYYKHTGYIGHLKETTLAKMWEKDPQRILKMAVSGMLPKNKLLSKRIKRLKIYI
jgi:large subunit ribosomal protein L13